MSMNDVLSTQWLDLDWSEWIPLEARHSVFRQLPACPGVYRIRANGFHQILYIGQTGRNLRERLNDLRRNLYGSVMPYNDPHTAAPNLWAWYQEEQYHFECSVLAVEKEKADREAFEDFLLWQHRLHTECSTLCNYGHFHPLYVKSKGRKTGFRGGKTTIETVRTTLPALQSQGEPDDHSWMGLSWSQEFSLDPVDVSSIPKQSGIYRIIDRVNDEVIYIGESHSLQNRYKEHIKKDWDTENGRISFVSLPTKTTPQQRKELETDLIGAFYGTYHRAPRYQYRNH
ncbi:MAG: hypothetical protein EP343_25375 [Deltaproteobacteria bacterium]|nr:MAG: hypothetical protein EP343_25375 [Deltaproteobacteria bacterium]